VVSSIIDAHAGCWLRRPFRVGSDDCAFAVRAILQEAGASSAYQNRVGEFTTPDAVDEFIAGETGGGGLVALVLQLARQHGWVRVLPRDAVDGDLALFRGPDRVPSIAIIRGPMMLTRANPGVVALPKTAASVAFRVAYGD